MERVLVAMSGGVDSTAAALLLKDRNYQVSGCTMHLWNDPESRGTGADLLPPVVMEAGSIASALGISLVVLEESALFSKKVIEPFVRSYLSCRTPSPCIRCNRYLKFAGLRDYADQHGFDLMATGHYARIGRDRDGRKTLLKGVDQKKDQSYFLFELTQDILVRLLFPVGEYRKAEIRELLDSRGFQVADKPESQEICFVPDGDHGQFIKKYCDSAEKSIFREFQIVDQEGPVYHRDGTLLGRHQGLYRYTVGQRKGLGIAHSRPLYILELDQARNALVLGYREDTFSRSLEVSELNWIAGKAPDRPFGAVVKIRSTHSGAEATVIPGRTRSGKIGARIDFNKPQASVAPGQAAVFYDGELVLGGGWIERGIPVG